MHQDSCSYITGAIELPLKTVQQTIVVDETVGNTSNPLFSCCLILTGQKDTKNSSNTSRSHAIIKIFNDASRFLLLYYWGNGIATQNGTADNWSG
jgi:hypothetical protein